ncbi:C39 family peptidase [Clostridium septicum]|uniref:C39 family peptidase n=1 Tax=Clostridium septicum TaxID=1504 RepID=UPI00272E9CD3|nr:C39 family peptidase [Clostridium septicum]WLF68912.1 C39 family peptidase [Clostridium septicum]
MDNSRKITNKSIKEIKMRKRKRRKFKRIIGSIAILLAVYMGYGVFNSIFYNEDLEKEKKVEEIKKVVKVEKSEKPEQPKQPEEVDYLSKIPEEIKNSNDLMIQKLLQKANDNQKVAMMLSDIKSYPKQLLELASKKDEVIDFVANYPNHKKSKGENISIIKDYKKGEIPLFIQWDERWGYENYGSEFIAINGCGPTSLAMVAVGLTGNTHINPKVVSDSSEKNGYLVEGVGSDWKLMTEGAIEFGVNGRELPLSADAIISTLQSGQPIIASMAPGVFTTTGHYIVLTGVDSNNKIIVNDPDSKIKSKQAWDLDVFMRETDNLWAFTAI